MLGAMRLLPAGIALAGWAAATGRPQPKTAAAWVWITAFALVDGAAFQVGLRGSILLLISSDCCLARKLSPLK